MATHRNSSFVLLLEHLLSLSRIYSTLRLSLKVSHLMVLVLGKVKVKVKVRLLFPCATAMHFGNRLIAFRRG